MEYCEGGNLLDNFIGEYDEQKIENVMIQIGQGIKYLHENNILHRDLKLDNIFFGKNQFIKIGDLGSAKLMKQSLTNTRVGSVFYMANEVLECDNYGSEVDIWSLGLVFIELAIGEKITNLVEGIELPCQRSMFPTKKIRQNIRIKKWLAIIEKMLEKDPKNRITIQEVLKLLNNKQIVAELKNQDIVGKELNFKNLQFGLKIKKISVEDEKQFLKGAKNVKRIQYEVITQEGEMNGNILEGRGVRTYKDIGKYLGQFKNGKQSGTGIYNSKSGNSYEGQWKQNNHHGKGRYQFDFGNWYEGTFENGEYKKGIFYYAGGMVYEGQFMNGQYNGRGTYYYLQYDMKYTGEFKDNKYHGMGIYTWKNGDRYEGQYLNEKRNGVGVFTKSNGDLQLALSILL